MNNDETNIDLNLTNVHDGQYLTVDDNDGTVKIAQVQESSVDNSYNLNPVDIANITLDLSNNYDLLKTLVEEATKEKLDISNLIIKWLKDYPTISKNLAEAQNLANEKDKELNADAEQIQTLESKNQQLEKELADLKAKPSEPATKPDDQSKPGTSNTTNTTVSSDQPANKD
jgi:septal ring factor EnvC (AmiA/AmiB activator)